MDEIKEPSMKKTAVAVLLGVCAALLAPGAYAATKDKKVAAKTAAPKPAAEVVTDVPPPSGSWEAKPPPAEGYVWSQGYYAWKDGRYQWKGGEWVLKQEGKEYRQHQWTQRADGKWQLTGGDWVEPGHKVAGNQHK
ncbi:YXWGXW repeat-containing protein [Ramlibacter albus]|uniref:YXWGXW repeat-containing protein n=1 Tax=Ramlibacter albus TaxID=2079448 RepID=A0A923MB58_9BURK|nr:YXWGXW repeat-containing protein [Ramlibacter albus]MBC5766138.1 YXWGXW repeat-containing protein [Ramlibacter albus]